MQARLRPFSSRLRGLPDLYCFLIHARRAIGGGGDVQVVGRWHGVRGVQLRGRRRPVHPHRDDLRERSQRRQSGSRYAAVRGDHQPYVRAVSPRLLWRSRQAAGMSSTRRRDLSVSPVMASNHGGSAPVPGRYVVPGPNGWVAGRLFAWPEVTGAGSSAAARRP